MLNTFKRTVRHNLFAKLMALIAAFVLWLFVMENENPTIERSYTLPIEVVNAGDSYDYTLSKKNVKIKISAKRIYFANLNTDKLRATVDFSGAGIDGEFDAPILIELPKGYESVEKSEDKVRVTLDPYILTPIAVDIKERGSSLDIERVASVQSVEPTIKIRGTAKNTAKVHKLMGYVDLIGKDSDFEQEVILIPVDNSGSEVAGVEITTPTVLVKVKMKKNNVAKNVSVEATFTDKNAPFTATVTPAYIEITGDDTTLEKITMISTEPITPTSIGNIKAKLIFPDGVSAKIDSVTVNIKSR